MDYKSFAKIIKENRILSSYTTLDMAKYLGISKSKYNRIELGIQEPSFDILIELIHLFKIDFNKIVIETKKPRKLFLD